MYKTVIASFFLLVFVALVSAPATLRMVDDSLDTSFFYSLSEEEKGHETVKILELFHSNSDSDLTVVVNSPKSDANGFDTENYKTPFLNLISPPPK